MKFIILFLFSGLSCVSFGQNNVTDESGFSYPEGVYLNFEDFLEKKPSTTKRVEARNVLKPKQVINDPTIDNCYFNYRRTKKRVKDAFAISYKDNLFLHVKSLQNMMDKKDKKQKIEFKDSFIRVVDHGRYLYLEGYVRKGGGLGFSIGGGPISVGTGGPQEELKAILFDFDSERFDLIRDCKDFNDFLIDTRTITDFKCEGKSIPIEIVRKIVFDINHMEQQ